MSQSRLQQRFDKIAANYNEFALLPKEIGQRLFERLDFIKIQPQVILDLGAGTSFFSTQLQARFPQAQVVSLDLSIGMIKQNPHPFSICGDALQLPFADKSVDFIFANFLLPYIEDLESFFLECHRVMKNGGLFLFTGLAANSFAELKTAWQIQLPHYQFDALPDLHDIGDIVLQAEFTDPVIDCERIKIQYPNFKKLFQELHYSGSFPKIAQRKGLFSSLIWQRICESFHSHYYDAGFYPLSFEIVYGQAWVMEKAKQTSDTMSIPLSHLRGLRRNHFPSS